MVITLHIAYYCTGILQWTEVQVSQGNAEFDYEINTGCYSWLHEAQVLQDNAELGYHITVQDEEQACTEHPCVQRCSKASNKLTSRPLL